MEHTATQEKHPEWAWQWARYEDDAAFLFRDWILPNRLEDFRGKRVLDAGCGPGHHIRLVAPFAAHVTGLDLNTAALARERTADLANVTIEEGDIATWRAAEPFDVVYCVGVIHHTDDPDATFENLRRMCRPGGRLVIWCYSEEGNWMARRLVEPLRRRLLEGSGRASVERLSAVLTALLYAPVHTVYRLPLRSLPYHEYFANFRRLGFRRNMLNVFDKLNAPQTDFISRARVERWFASGFEDVSITPYAGVSWRGSGSLRRICTQARVSRNPIRC
ncbi:MAG: class I SAM-dependent methyltransferase [Deltaproteobacteria bacterium]|nr:class I SAM-dependent methyltransferase [Deltaproteobacteria bacterium]